MATTHAEELFDLGPNVSRRFNFETGFVPYWNVLWLFVGLGLLSALIEPFIGYRSVGYIFLLGVLFVGSVGAAGPVLFAALLSLLIWNFSFIPPRFTFNITRPDDIILCMTYFASALVTGFLTRRIRESEAFSRVVEGRTDQVFDVLKELSESEYGEGKLENVLSDVGAVVNGECGLVVKESSGKLPLNTEPIGIHSLDDREKAKVELAFSRKEASAWPTLFDTEGQIVAMPLVGSRETVGVFIFRPRKKKPLSEDQKTILSAVSKQIALFVETNLLAERLDASEARRFPLVERDSTPERSLPTNRRVGTVGSLRGDVISVHSLVGCALENMPGDGSDRSVKIEISRDMPNLDVDRRRVASALADILKFCLHASAAGSEIRIWSSARGNDVLLLIEDNGSSLETRGLKLSSTGEIDAQGRDAGRGGASAESSPQKRPSLQKRVFY